MLTNRDLQIAARGRVDELTVLLDERPDVVRSRLEGHGRTLLWEAVRRRRGDAVALLIERGADVHAPGRHRSEDLVLLAPIAVAVSRGSDAIEVLLRRAGAVVDVYSAAFLGNRERLTEILDRDAGALDRAHPADSLWSAAPLHYALCGGADEAIDELLHRGADVRTHGALLLEFAARRGRADLFRRFVDLGADVRAVPVFAILRSGDPDLLRESMARGLDIERPDDRGWPPLVYVSRGDKGGRFEPVTWLLEAGADVNVRGPHGLTALHVAARAGFPDVLLELLRYGAAPSIRADSGMTALALARRAGRRRAVGILAGFPGEG